MTLLFPLKEAEIPHGLFKRKLGITRGLNDFPHFPQSLLLLVSFLINTNYRKEERKLRKREEKAF